MSHCLEGNELIPTQGKENTDKLPCALFVITSSPDFPPKVEAVAR